MINIEERGIGTAGGKPVTTLFLSRIITGVVGGAGRLDRRPAHGFISARIRARCLLEFRVIPSIFHAVAVARARLASGFSAQGETLTERRHQSGRYHKPVVGLSGGVGSGKSAVARILAELGAAVIDSDELSRREIDMPEVRAMLVRWWGTEVLDSEGEVDRKRVSSIVFGNPSQRHRLESLLHPRIAVRRADLMAEYDKRQEVRMIVLDSPLLYEVDLDLICDAVVFIEADFETRLKRSEKSRQWSREELVRRENSQQPLDMKRARADHTCINESTLATLRAQVEGIFAQIVSKAGAI